MVHEKQKPMEYGFIDFCGNTWKDPHVDTYNNYTRRINESSGVDIKSDSLTAKDRERLLNNRHDYFTTVMGIYLN